MTKEEKSLEHEFVPKHELISEEEAEKVLKEYGIKKEHLPKLFQKDPAIVSLDLNRGDVVKISRDSPTAGKHVYYRVII